MNILVIQLTSLVVQFIERIRSSGFEIPFLKRLYTFLAVSVGAVIFFYFLLLLLSSGWSRRGYLLVGHTRWIFPHASRHVHATLTFQFVPGDRFVIFVSQSRSKSVQKTAKLWNFKGYFYIGNIIGDQILFIFFFVFFFSFVQKFYRFIQQCVFGNLNNFSWNVFPCYSPFNFSDANFTL